MEEVLNYINNYFYKFGVIGKFTIAGNKIYLQGNYYKSQYIYIKGSMLNDGIYEVKDIIDDELYFEGLDDEVFDGVIYSLRVPKQLKEKVKEIQDFKTTNKPSQMQSESFGGYSYTRASVNGKPMTWKDVYKDDLAPYNKIYNYPNRIPLLVLDKDIAKTYELVSALNEVFFDTNEFVIEVK